MKKLTTDFYIPSQNLIIEYNGEQHYRPVRFGQIRFGQKHNCTQKQADENFIKQQARDELLKNYCKENNINLLEIDGRKYYLQSLKNYITTNLAYLVQQKRAA